MAIDVEMVKSPSNRSSVTFSLHQYTAILPTESVKDQYTECFKFFDELISSVTAFKCRHHSVANSLSMSTTSLCSPSESSLDLDSNHRRDTQITRPPRRSKSYGNLPNEVIKSLKKNVYKNGSVKNLFKSLHSPLSQTKSFE